MAKKRRFQAPDGTNVQFSRSGCMVLCMRCGISIVALRCLHCGKRGIDSSLGCNFPNRLNILSPRIPAVFSASVFKYKTCQVLVEAHYHVRSVRSVFCEYWEFVLAGAECFFCFSAFRNVFARAQCANQFPLFAQSTVMKLRYPN